ncbi:MAG: roadblock/LC7 domain-containing protein [Candidatus Thorarchaeota archaeon]
MFCECCGLEMYDPNLKFCPNCGFLLKIIPDISFDKILSKIINSERGIEKVILVDRTGLTIASVSKFSYFRTNVHEIGAVASAVFYASEEQGENLELGDLEMLTSEFSEGKIFVSNFGRKIIISLISDSDVNIGLIRLILKRSGDVSY